MYDLFTKYYLIKRIHGCTTYLPKIKLFASITNERRGFRWIQCNNRKVFSVPTKNISSDKETMNISAKNKYLHRKIKGI